MYVILRVTKHKLIFHSAYTTQYHSHPQSCVHYVEIYLKNDEMMLRVRDFLPLRALMVCRFDRPPEKNERKEIEASDCFISVDVIAKLAEKTTNDDSILELSVRNDFSFYVNFFAVAAVGSTVFFVCLFLFFEPSSLLSPFLPSLSLFSPSSPIPSIFLPIYSTKREK